MNTAKPKTKQSRTRSQISDFWMFFIGLGLVFASNFSDLQSFEQGTSTAINTNLSGDYSESRNVRKAPLVTDRKSQIAKQDLTSDF